MFTTGLVSVSFRPKSPKEIIDKCVECKLEGIEWGSDIHVPCGDIKTAESVRRLSDESGVKVFAYGSYYRLGCPDHSFGEYLTTAKALGAPIIRIWCGTQSPDKLSPEELVKLSDEAKEISEMAAKENITVATECHLGTMTENYKSALLFFDMVGCDNFKTYWQPNQNNSFEYNKEAARVLAPLTAGIHVFHWDEHARYPLAEGEKYWNEYLKAFSPDSELPLMLEFMHDDRIESLNDAADTLRSFIDRRENK